MQAASEQAVAKIEPLSEAVANRRVEHERNAILLPPNGCNLIEQTRAKPVATLGVCHDEVVDVDGWAAHQHLVEPVPGQTNGPALPRCHEQVIILLPLTADTSHQLCGIDKVRAQQNHQREADRDLFIAFGVPKLEFFHDRPFSTSPRMLQPEADTNAVP